MDEATDLCVKYGGSLSGEHGDGQARGEFLYKMFGHEYRLPFANLSPYGIPTGR